MTSKQLNANENFAKKRKIQKEFELFTHAIVATAESECPYRVVALCENNQALYLTCDEKKGYVPEVDKDGNFYVCDDLPKVAIACMGALDANNLLSYTMIQRFLKNSFVRKDLSSSKEKLMLLLSEDQKAKYANNVFAKEVKK